MINQAQQKVFAGGSSRLLGVTALNFYRENYDVVFTANLEPGGKHFLAATVPRVCRFCNQQAPKVSFKQKTHAISGLTGNTTLFTYEECDTCNARFGALEDDLGKFTLPARIFGRVSGRRGIRSPKIPTGRIDALAGGFRFEVDREAIDNTFADDPDARSMTVSIPIQPYRPLGVYKALLKMHLTVAPGGELPPFQPALRWLSSDGIEDNIASDFFGFPCIQMRGAKAIGQP